MIDIRAFDGEALPEDNAATVFSLIEQVAVPVDAEEALHRLFEWRSWSGTGSSS